MENKGNKKKMIATVCAGILAFVVIVGGVFFLIRKNSWESPEELLLTYMDHVSHQEYEEMYAMLDVESSGNISQEEFTERNSAIYEGIEMQNMKIEITEYNEKRHTVTYQTTFDTAAGSMNFESKALFLKGEKGYELVWNDSLILPGLERADKVRVSRTEAERGEIVDRNGRLLAGKGTASSVGIVPGKLEDRTSAVQTMAELLDMEPEAIEKKLTASWVKEDTFVPVKTIAKVDERDLLALEPDEDVMKEKERQDQLLAIPGVMITNTEVRVYPFKEAAAHLVGYVQNVTAEDLEEHAGEGYTANSVIGRSGMESLYEKELKGQDGCRIYTEDAEGNEKAELVNTPVQNGETIQLTIDAELQNALYEEFKEDKSCSVAMHPETGEVLALVSTPSYDTNDFILGMSTEKWDALNGDENTPLLNRFRQTWCPGSSLKPVIAGIGLETGAIDPSEDYGSEGLSWQKDSSWGSYFVTTLHEAAPATLENALLYSDNIYFAKAALRIGAENLETSLSQLGFGEEVPFPIKMTESQYTNAEGLETEIQLADSGYGQGQMLVNPLHMACLYSAFCNEGNMIQPYLLCQDGVETEYWIKNAFSADTARQVLEGLKKVVNDENGTGYAAHRGDMVLAGKTGTAEIKASQDDTSGTELGWFAVFTTEKTASPILLVTMTEDVKGRGGSGYVVEKDKKILDNWFEGVW